MFYQSMEKSSSLILVKITIVQSAIDDKAVNCSRRL